MHYAKKKKRGEKKVKKVSLHQCAYTERESAPSSLNSDFSTRASLFDHRQRSSCFLNTVKGRGWNIERISITRTLLFAKTYSTQALKAFFNDPCAHTHTHTHPAKSINSLFSVLFPESGKGVDGSFPGRERKREKMKNGWGRKRRRGWKGLQISFRCDTRRIYDWNETTSRRVDSWKKIKWDEIRVIKYLYKDSCFFFLLLLFKIDSLSIAASSGWGGTRIDRSTSRQDFVMVVKYNVGIEKTSRI